MRRPRRPAIIVGRSPVPRPPPPVNVSDIYRFLTDLFRDGAAGVAALVVGLAAGRWLFRRAGRREIASCFRAV